MSTPKSEMPRSVVKRAAILSAARHRFAVDGYERASTEAVAREAGVSTATLFRHFSSKQELFEEILTAAVNGFAKDFSADSGADPADRLKLLAHSYADLLGDRETAALIRAVLTAVPAFPELASTFYDRVKTIIADCFHRTVKQLEGEGLISLPSDHLIPGSQLMGMIEHVTLWRAMLTGSEPEPNLPELVDVALESFWIRWRC